MPRLLRTLLDSGPFPGKAAIGYRLLVAGCVLAATAAGVLRTVDGLPSWRGWPADAVDLAALVVLGFDLVLQLANAVVSRRPGQTAAAAVRHHLASTSGVIDMLAVLPSLAVLAMSRPADWDAVLGILRFLKLARYSPALETLGAVVRREWRTLQSAAFIIALLLLSTSTTLYLVERHVNPHFASIPHAMWWSIVTLTTLGYGDVVPISTLGKVLCGVVALLGIGMFALPASILASGFAEETRRRDFLTTWHMVAKVPFFAGLDAEQIASITTLLRYRTAAPADVLMRAGDFGETMYFIVSGVVAVDFGAAQPTLLQDGDFFGEIALLRHSRRTATVTARTRCQLLSLHIRDFRRFLVGNPQIADLIADTADRRLHEQGEPVH